MRGKRNDEGFSIVELMIVVVVASIILSITVPRLLQARRSAIEASAVQTLRNYTSAQLTYLATTGSYGNYGTINDLVRVGLVDATLVGGVKSGYRYNFVLGNPPISYTVNADPSIVDTDSRFFFTNETGVIRFNIGAPADENSQPIPEFQN